MGKFVVKQRWAVLAVMLGAAALAGIIATLPGWAQTSTSATIPGCAQDSDCAGAPVWGGATFCLPVDLSFTTQVSKYQTKPVCQAGICTTKSAPAVWEDCGPAGKICGFASAGGGTFQCVANPVTVCAPGALIASACLCGSISYAGYGYCCLGADSKPFHSPWQCLPSTVSRAGDGICQSDESPYTVPQDCGSPKTYSGTVTFPQGKGGTYNVGFVAGNIINVKNTGSAADTFRVTLPTNPDNRCGVRISPGGDPLEMKLPNPIPATLDVPLAAQETKYIVPRCITSGLTAASFTYSVKVVSLGAEAVNRLEVNPVMGEVQDAITLVPLVACTDTDGGMDSSKKGTGTGIYAGAAPGLHFIFGQEPNPNSPKPTTNNFSTFIDHCSWDPSWLNEGFCDASGKLQAIGIKCANGCQDGICKPASSPLSALNSDVVGYWKFDGNGNNEVAGGPAAVAVGSAVFKASGGKFDGYAYIPGSGDWFKIPYRSDFDLPNSFTVEFWFRQRSNQSFNQNLVYKGSPPNNYNFSIFRYLWNQYNSGAVIAGHTAQNSGYWTQASNPNEPAHGLWHHVVYTKSASAQAYYIDGALVHSKDFTQYSEYSGPVKTPATDIIIGDSAIDTDIDNLRIYNRALSASEALQNSGFPPPAPTPVAPPVVTPAPQSTSTLIQSPTSILAPTPSTVPILLPTPTPAVAASPTLLAATSTLIGQCLQAGGLWCYRDLAASLGYCAPTTTVCASGEQVGRLALPQTATGSLPSAPVEPRSEAQTREQFLAERRAVLQDLRALERLVRREIIEVDGKQLKTIKEKILSFKPGREVDPGVLQPYREQITNLRGSTTTLPEAELAPDSRLERNALQQLQQGLRLFKRHITTVEGKVAKIEKSGITVDATIKDTIDSAKSLAKRVAEATSYSDIRAIAAQIPDAGQALNDTLPRLEELLQLPSVLRLVERRIAAGERELRQASILVKRLRLEMAGQLAEARGLITDARSAVAEVKSGGVTTDLVNTLKEQVFSNVDEVVGFTDTIRAVASVRQAINQETATIKRYEARLRRLQAAGEEVPDALELTLQLKEHLAGLKEASLKRLTPDVGDQIIDYLKVMAELKAELEDALHLSAPDVMPALIKRLLTSPRETIKPFRVEQLERGVL